MGGGGGVGRGGEGGGGLRHEREGRHGETHMRIGERDQYGAYVYAAQAGASEVSMLADNVYRTARARETETRTYGTPAYQSKSQFSIKGAQIRLRIVGTL